MPPQRKTLGPISENLIKGKHITPYMRGKIMGCSIAGSTPAQIALGLKVDDSTIQYAIVQDLLQHEGFSLPRKDRAKSYTDAEERLLLRHVRLNPKDTYT